MANWLLDYIEMTEYIPIEFRDQSFLMRELDLKVSIAMNDLEQEIKEFFTNVDTLNPQEKQAQYEALLEKCDSASKAANDKVRMADRLHDLVEKSMRLLDRGLEKLKEELLEGDKAYIVEDLEKRSQELDEQMQQEQEALLRQQHNRLKDFRLHSRGHSIPDHVNNHHNHRHSLPAVQNHPHIHHHHTNPVHNRNRNNSTGMHNSSSKQRKRERKRLNSAMTIFNRNSRTDDDSTNQTILSSPSTPDYLIGLQNSNSNSLNDISGGDNSGLTLKGMMAGNRNSTSNIDNSNGKDALVRARQPILTAIDAAHAVSPKATNSDKLGLFSSNLNGDNYNNSNHFKQSQLANHLNQNQLLHEDHLKNRLSGNLLSTVGLNSSHSTSNSGSNNALLHKTYEGQQSHDHQNERIGGPFSTLPLAARHDPIMMAASQAINATQKMTQGRRTSSLKASYAAVNSGRLQPAQNHPIFDQTALTPNEVYCKCRGTIHDLNMIACDNSKCKYEWFHYQCVGITDPPAGEWFCEDCRGHQKNQVQNTASKQTKTSGMTPGQTSNKVVHNK